MKKALHTRVLIFEVPCAYAKMMDLILIRESLRGKNADTVGRLSFESDNNLILSAFDLYGNLLGYYSTGAKFCLYD